MQPVRYPTEEPALLISNAMITKDDVESSDFETIDLSESVDYEKIFEALEEEEKKLKAALAKAKGSQGIRDQRAQSETRVGLALEKLTSGLPDRVVFDKRFWLYIGKRRPAWIGMRYDLVDEPDREGGPVAKSQERIRGRPARHAIAAATLVPRLLVRLGMDPGKTFSKLGSRARMFVLDEVPLSDPRMMRGFITLLAAQTKAQDAYLDKLWAEIAIATGSIVVESLSDADVEELLDECHSAALARL